MPSIAPDVRREEFFYWPFLLFVGLAFESVSGNLSNIHLFHTDHGSEFRNRIIDDILYAFEIDRSLSRKGSPHDNVVAEARLRSSRLSLLRG